MHCLLSDIFNYKKVIFFQIRYIICIVTCRKDRIVSHFLLALIGIARVWLEYPFIAFDPVFARTITRLKQ